MENFLRIANHRLAPTFKWDLRGFLKEAAAERRSHPGKLVDQDSNLDKQNQNLPCYRYTIDQ